MSVFGWALGRFSRSSGDVFRSRGDLRKQSAGCTEALRLPGVLETLEPRILLSTVQDSVTEYTSFDRTYSYAHQEASANLYFNLPDGATIESITAEWNVDADRVADVIAWVQIGGESTPTVALTAGWDDWGDGYAETSEDSHSWYVTDWPAEDLVSFHVMDVYGNGLDAGRIDWCEVTLLYEYEPDTQGPAITQPAMEISSDTGMDATDGVTKLADPTFEWDRPVDFGGGTVDHYLVSLDAQPDAGSMVVYSRSVQLSSISDGAHTLYVRAVDDSGNLGETGSVVFFVDTQSPATPTLEISAVSSPSAQVQTPLDQAVEPPSEEPSGEASGIPVGQPEDSGLDSGQSLDDRTMMVPENIPPMLGLVVTDNSVSLQYESSDNVGGSGLWTYHIGLTPGQAEVSTTDPSRTMTLSAEGTTTFYVWAEDVAGNVSEVASAAVTLDSSAPSAPATVSPVEGEVIQDSECLLEWTPSSDAGSGVARYEVVVESADRELILQKWTSDTQRWFDLRDAPRACGYVWRVRAMDWVGHFSAWSADLAFQTLLNVNVTAFGDVRFAPADLTTEWEAVGLTENDIDADGDPLTVTAVTATAETHGTVQLVDGVIRYQPDPGYLGEASFTYTVDDGWGGQDEATVEITVGRRYVVNTTADSIVADGMLSLREAVSAANEMIATGDAPAGAGGRNRIVFDPSLNGETVALDPALGDLHILRDLEILGPGAAQLTIDGQGQTRLMFIDSDADAHIAGLTLTGGSAAFGGAIVNFSSLTLQDAILAGNSASVCGAAIHSQYGSLTLIDTHVTDNTGQDLGAVTNGKGRLTVSGGSFQRNLGKWGGGLSCYYYSNATVESCLFADNTAVEDGGGVYLGTGVEATFTECTFRSNSSKDGGAAVSLGEDVEWIDCEFADNQAEFSGGAIYSDAMQTAIRASSFSGNSARYGGAIYQQGSLTVDQSTFSGNTARTLEGTGGFGGGIRVTTGSAVLTASDFTGNHADRYGGAMLAWSHTPPTLTIYEGTYQSNTAGELGGGICAVCDTTISDADFLNNSITTTGSGGAIFVQDHSLSLTGGTISDNASEWGGGVLLYNAAGEISASEFARNAARFGGGLHLDGGSSATIDGACFRENTAIDAGGGVYLFTDAVASVASSVFRDNHSDAGGAVLAYRDTQAAFDSCAIIGGDGFGQAIYNLGDMRFRQGLITGCTGTYDPVIYSDASMQIVQSTIASNDIGWAAVVNELDGPPILLRNSIIANNGSGSDVLGNFDPASDYNIIGNIGTVSEFDGNNICGTAGSPLDPQLSYDWPDGQAMPWLVPLSTSPALDAGLTSYAPDPLHDIRGGVFTRESGNCVDIGAYERHLLGRHDSLEMQEDTTLPVPVADLIANDANPLNRPLSITEIEQPGGGHAVTVDGDDLVIVPAADFWGTFGFRYTVQDDLGEFDVVDVSVSVALRDDAAVVGRYVFANQSHYDRHTAGPSTYDDAAIYDYKAALLPGQQAGAANVTPFSKGINGIMIDIDDPSTVPAVSDFVFTAGNTPDSSTWQPAPAPLSVTVRPGEGVDGSDRVTIIWADGAIANRWLKVRVLSGANGGSLGLAGDDVFAFGDLTGDLNGNGRVSFFEAATVVARIGQWYAGAHAGDLDEDVFVDVGDADAAVGNIGAGLTMSPDLSPAVPPAIPDTPKAPAGILMAGGIYASGDDPIKTEDASAKLCPLARAEPFRPAGPADVAGPVAPAGGDLPRVQTPAAAFLARRIGDLQDRDAVPGAQRVVGTPGWFAGRPSAPAGLLADPPDQGLMVDILAEVQPVG